MFKKRFLIVLGVLALIVVMFFTFQQAASAGAIRRAGQSNAQTMQWEAAILRSHRGGMKPDLFLTGQSTPTAGASLSLLRSRAADTARWTAMGEYYKRLEEYQMQRSRAAEAARWNAMVEYYRLMTPAAP